MNTLIKIITLSLVSVLSCSVPVQAADIGQDSSTGKGWKCVGADNEDWRCYDLNRHDQSITKAAVANTDVIFLPANADIPDSQKNQPATTVTTATTVQATLTTVPAKKEQTKPVTPPSEETTSSSLEHYPANHIAVQLIAGRTPATIEKYRQQNPGVAGEVVTVINQGKAMYLLIAGVYPDTEQARQAVAKLPLVDAEQPWLRPAAGLNKLRMASKAD